MRETAVLSAEAMVDATILNQVLKYAIDRQDPQQGRRRGPLLASWNEDLAGRPVDAL